MPELDQRRSPWNEGLSVPWLIVSRDLFRLACIFHASQSIENHGTKGLVELRRQFQESEIGHLLISVASVLRNAIDQNPGRANYWANFLDSDSVGTLTSNVKARAKPKPLSFREACNKIVHCTTLNYDYVTDKPRVGDPLLPKVHLYGWKNDIEWKATLDINRFVAIAEHFNV